MAAPLHAQVRFWRDPDLPGVEARASSYRKQAFRTHTHATFSIGMVEDGSTSFFLSGQRHAAGPGQLVLIPPGAPHACNPDQGAGMAYRMLYLAPAWLKAAAGGSLPLFPPVLDDPELFAAWRDLHEAYAQGAPAGAKQAMLLACLLALVERHARPAEAGERPENAAVALAMEQLERLQQEGRRMPLDELARLAGLSPHHFLRVFKDATGLPPHAYQVQQAIEHAKALLAGGMPISQAALDSGFADQSHFSRVFRQFTGATPRQYLETSPGEPDR